MNRYGCIRLTQGADVATTSQLQQELLQACVSYDCLGVIRRRENDYLLNQHRMENRPGQMLENVDYNVNNSKLHLPYPDHGFPISVPSVPYPDSHGVYCDPIAMNNLPTDHFG